MRSGFSRLPLNETLMSALHTPTLSAQRHTVRPPTAKDSTPAGGVCIHHQNRQQAALPSQLGARLHTQTGSKQTALADGTHKQQSDISQTQTNQPTNGFCSHCNHGRRTATVFTVAKDSHDHQANRQSFHSNNQVNQSSHSFIHSYIHHIQSFITFTHHIHSFTHHTIRDNGRAG